jgi:hypothetical protein
MSPKSYRLPGYYVHSFTCHIALRHATCTASLILLDLITMNQIVKLILITSLPKIRGFIVNESHPAILRRHVFQRCRVMLVLGY